MNRSMAALLAMIAAGAALIYAVSAFWGPAAREETARQDIRQALFDELTTVTLKNCTLERYGSANDGGYLMCANLMDGAQAAYSYGIDKEDNWGCQVSKQLAVPVHQYDCFTPHRPTCEGGQFIFHDECVGARSEAVDGQPFDTITSQISRNGDAGKNLLLKIDVEGAEWDSLMATPDAVLDQIRQMPMEFHGVDQPKFVEVVRHLKRKFYLVNLHFNNFGCQSDVRPFPAFAFQVLWVNKRIGEIDEKAPSPAAMSPLNAPDQPGHPDCQLAPTGGR
jgi:hypothetical protein